MRELSCQSRSLAYEVCCAAHSQDSSSVPADYESANTPLQHNDLEHVLPPCLAKIRKTNPDLASVLESWDRLSDPVKKGILAMVQASLASPDSSRTEAIDSMGPK